MILTKEQLIKAFTQWKLSYDERPEDFNEDWAELEGETYGEQAAAYLLKLLNEE